jgi:spore coat protein U-like protein
MFGNKKFGSMVLAAAAVSFSGGAVAATEASSSLGVDGTLVAACEVSSAATIAFGSVIALASTTAPSADTGTTFQVACSADATPRIYASGTRTLVEGSNSIPFNLSLTSGAANDDLPSTSQGATALTMTQDGTLKTVPIYARLPTANFQALESGTYTASGLSLIVTY